MNGDEGNPVLLYAHPSMDRLATQIVERCTGNMPESQKKRLRAERSISISSQRNVEYKQTIEWGKFNDGFPNLFIQEVKEMAGKDVIFLGSFHSPEVIFEQLSILYAFPRYLAKSFHFILPYFPTGTMERVDREGQIATAKTLATLLSAIPLTSKGPAQIIIFDIHALQERFYFSDNVIPRNVSGMCTLHIFQKGLQNYRADNDHRTNVLPRERNKSGTSCGKNRNHPVRESGAGVDDVYHSQSFSQSCTPSEMPCTAGTSTNNLAIVCNDAIFISYHGIRDACRKDFIS
ncbi:uncharacterized protein [Haliotis asinina]|uniref:uncharacterized protein isoform X2 n=1 Tax=Haliotis asinina TaxID=109174 RepID=UPI003531BB1F